MSGVEKGNRTTRAAELLALLELYPHGIDRKEAIAKLCWCRGTFNNLVAALDKTGAVKTWQVRHEKRQKTSFVTLNRGPRQQPGTYTPPTNITLLPAVSSRAQEAYKVVRQLQHRDARHLAHAAGYSYGYAAEMMAELQQAGAL